MNYYNDKLIQGNEYEKYIINELGKLGITLTLTDNYVDQINIGETKEGYEIKYDDIYQNTKNLWIETEERKTVKNEYIQSGIFRKDNSKYYIIGDYTVIFLFKKEKLMEVSKEYDIKENHRKTSKGFILPESDALKYCDKIFYCNELDVKQTGLDNWM